MKNIFITIKIYLFLFILCGLAFQTSALAGIVYFPSSPELLFPVDNSTIQIADINSPIPFQWGEVVGADDYLLSILAEGQQIPSTYVTAATICMATIPITIEALPVKITWGVLPRKNGLPPHALTPDELRNFTLKIFENLPTVTPTPIQTPTPTEIPLPAPVLKSPANRAELTYSDCVNTVFEWAAVPGAVRYSLTLYENNSILTQNETENAFCFLSLTNYMPYIRTVYQWTVQAIDKKENPGFPSKRFSFSIGDGFLPDPAPVDLNADLNQDQKRNSLDLYIFALSFGTNDSSVDFNNSGLIEREDLLLFMKNFSAP